MGVSAPISIQRGSYLYSPSSTLCASPSWPQRSSLSGPDSSLRTSSFVADDELDFDDDMVEDDARSITSASSSSASPPMHIGNQRQAQNPYQAPGMPDQTSNAPALTDAQILEMQREQLARHRELVKFVLAEKERRREQMMRRRRVKPSPTSTSAQQQQQPGAVPSKKAQRSKLSNMTPIAE